MSDTFPRRLAHSIGQLALALLNATLILVVAALFLAWNVVNKMEHLAGLAIASATQQVAELSPLADEVSGLRADLSQLREDVADLTLIEDFRIAQAADSILVKLQNLEQKTSQMDAALSPAIDVITTDPAVLVDVAVETGIAAVGEWATGVSGCVVTRDNS